MNDASTDELQRLRREVRKLKRYRRIVYGQLFLSEKIARLVTLLWFGPSLVQAIQDVLTAHKKGTPLSDLETAQLIAAVIRRMLRIGLIAISLAILPVAVLVWQNTLMREQVMESRKQNLEIVRYNRKTDIKRNLSEVENQMAQIMDQPFGDARVPLGLQMRNVLLAVIKFTKNGDTEVYHVGKWAEV